MSKINQETVDAVGIEIQDQRSKDQNKQAGQKPCMLVGSKPCAEEMIYDTSHASIGTVIILNQVNFCNDRPRDGSDEDASTLKEVLTNLGFEVRPYKDFTVEKIKTSIKNAAKEDYTSKSCLMVFILTHGHEKGKLAASDGEFEVKDLYEPFLECSSLKGKPKLFFLQACRGGFTDVGVIAKTTPEHRLIDSTDAKGSFVNCYTIPTYADMLVMYSTIEGVVSFRNTSGSWFIQAFCEELKLRPHEDLLSILTNVNNRVAYDRQSYDPQNSSYDLMKQMPVVKYTLTKKFIIKKKAANGETSSKEVETDLASKCITCGR